ncbi:MAG: hypothetical protein H6581_12230 [Bacteroidia bacterium]|nr:hypothetical protein [Bacteroidia bacterium]
MKRNLGILLITASMCVFLGFFAGCNTRTPTDVAREFLNAISFGDFEKAEELASESSKSGLKSLAAFSDGENFEFEITGQEIDGDYARVYYKVEGSDEEKHLRLRKDDIKGWVVIFSKGDLPAKTGDIESVNDLTKGLGKGLGKAFEGLGTVVDSLGGVMEDVAKEMEEHRDEWKEEAEKLKKEHEKEWKEYEEELKNDRK